MIKELTGNFKKIIYKLIFQIYKFIRPKDFNFQNQKLLYENCFYNTSFINERSVEIPIIKSLIEEVIDNNKISNTLEIGNVLSYYKTDLTRDIVDKYEVAANVLNEDIEFYRPKKKYDLIISISTLEHVGNDEPEEKDPEKIIRVLNHITNNLLNENGTLIITLPINQNESTDNFIYTNNLLENYNILERKSLIFNTWHEIKFQDIKDQYKKKPLFIKHIYIVKLCNGNNFQNNI